MIVTAPLFAIGEGEIVAIIMVIAVIAEVIAKWREAQAAAKKAKPGQPAPAAGQDPLADEIGEFLRRASKRRGEASQRPARAAGTPRPARAQGRPAQAPRSGQAEQPAQPILVGEPDGGVAQHVQEHLKRTFKHLNPELGKEVAEADDKLDSRLHRVFDHQVGRLSGLAGESAKPTTTEEPGTPPPRVPAVPLAQAVAGMFTNPATVSQAILLHEILRRPEERWGS